MYTRNAKPSLKRVEYLDGWLVDELKERKARGKVKESSPLSGCGWRISLPPYVYEHDDGESEKSTEVICEMLVV